MRAAFSGEIPGGNRRAGDQSTGERRLGGYGLNTPPVVAGRMHLAGHSLLTGLRNNRELIIAIRGEAAADKCAGGRMVNGAREC